MQPGSIVAGRYEIEALAGVGGMGIVYRARDTASGARVALKTLRSMGPRAMRRFVEEAEMLATLEHPNIVRYLAHGVLGDRSLFLALEWIDGESLQSVIGRRGLSVRSSLRVAHRLAGALAWVHARGIVHADVKPSNVLLVAGTEDQPKLADFGIARLVGGDEPRSTFGTPTWMSPEQARGAEVDARADVFSLGAVLLTCLTGRPPFDSDSAPERAALTEDPPRLRESRPDLPKALDELLASMLASNPADRPASGAEVERALSGFLDVHGEAPPPYLADSETRETAQGTQGTSEGASATNLLAVRELRFGCAVVGVAADSGPVVALASLHGATVDRLDDQTFLAMVRGTGSATDLASRAATLALALRDVLPAARLALAAGAIDSTWQPSACDVVARGVSLLAGSTPGLQIDRNSAALLEGRFDLGMRDKTLLLLGERTTVDVPRRLLGRATPFVGRSNELRTLEESYQRAISEGRAQATVITGVAGIGKSRLRHELLARLRAPKLRTWIGEGDPMRFGTPFALISPIVRQVAGIEERDDLEARRRKLAARIARSIGRRADSTPALSPFESIGPAEAQDVTEFLGEIAGVPFRGEGSPRLIAARQSPLVMAHRVRESFRAFLAAELAQGPILLVLEDVHWGDLPSLRLVDQMLAAFEHAPFLVLAVGRPDVDKLFPDLWSARNAERIRLAELAPEAAHELAREVLGSSGDPAVLDDVVRRADGNAFYLEEVIRAVAEGRVDALPETVLAMTQSRLDALPADARRVLRACSVFNDVVTQEAVAALLGPPDPREVIMRLDDLVEREVLVRRTASGRARYSFRHALLREGAYATLTEGDRVDAHRLALGWLRADGHAEPLVLAEHAERAKDMGFASEMLLSAASEALVANDFSAAIARATRGLSHGATDKLRGALLVVQGQAHAFRNEWQEVVANEEALELATPGSAVWCTAAAGILWGRLELGEPEKIAPILFAVRGAEPESDAGSVLASTIAIVVPLLGWLGQQAIAAGFLERLEQIVATLSPDDFVSRGWLHLSRGHQAVFERNDLYTAVVEFRHAVDFATRSGDRTTLRPLAVGALGDALRALGRPHESEQLQREVLADTARALEFITGFSRAYLASALLARGDLDGAAATANEIVAGCGPKDRWREGAARGILAAVAEGRGLLAEAEDEATRAIELLDQVQFNIAGVRALRAGIRLRRGNHEGAREDALAAHDILETIGSLGSTESGVRLVCAHALAASGDQARAADVLRAAMAVLERRSAGIADPELRAAFEAMPEHVQTRALAGVWLV